MSHPLHAITLLALDAEALSRHPRQKSPIDPSAGIVAAERVVDSGLYKDAPDLVYAVDEDRKGRLIAIITGQLARSGLVQLSGSYAFEDFKNDLRVHGAVVVFTATTFSCYEPFSELKHPPSVEQGDCYSSEAVSAANIERIIVGQDVVDWLKPHEVDFKCRYREILGKG